ncbi:hypothetical protein EAI_08897 [Harpegnathos saltator]|uniref:Odorant receptor 13a n=1 Tax=Harpegnathos saltator TaxID=610380 RepID=E2BSB5_HARSA|nr:hypothetical protein EAI_08897 [Harpegnathos saltator]
MTACRRFNEMWRTMSMNWEFGSACTSAIDNAGKMHVLRHLPNFIVAFNSMSVIMTSANTLSNAIHYDEASNTTRSYILMMHLSFDINKQSVYLVVIFLQFFYMLIITAGAATINAVLVILMLYLGGQVDVICRCLTHMPQGEHVGMTDVMVVKEIIRKHQSVITFSEHIESLYTYIALILLLLNTLITCGLGFILVTVSSKEITNHGRCRLSLRRRVQYVILIIRGSFKYKPDFLSADSERAASGPRHSRQLGRDVWKEASLQHSTVAVPSSVAP